MVANFLSNLQGIDGNRHTCLLARTQMYSSQDTDVCWPGHKYILARTQIYSSQDIDVCWPGHRCILARTLMSAGQDRDIFWPGHRCLLARTQMCAEMCSGDGSGRVSGGGGASGVVWSGVIFPHWTERCFTSTSSFIQPPRLFLN